MTQPDYVPITPADRVRPVERLPPARDWRAERPADLKGPQPSGGRGLGTQGPDQGYGLLLADRFRPGLVLAEGERADDAAAGCLGVALRRAALFERAPVVYDLELAFTLWGFLGGAPEDLVAYRRPFFVGAAHHYRQRRAIAERVPEATLRLSPAQVGQRLGEWRTLIDSA